MRPSTDCIDLNSCLSDITSTTIGACADIVVTRFDEPPVESFVHTFKVVRQMLRADVPC